MMKYLTPERLSKSSFLWLTLLIAGCQQQTVPTFKFSDPFDTQDQTIAIQTKKVFNEDSLIWADNLFDGARLNDFSRINDSTFQVVIAPENEPINPSPWYAFRVYAQMSTTVFFQMEYGDYKHRYYPKISTDGAVWKNLDSANILYDTVQKMKSFSVDLLANDTLWVAGQDVISSDQVQGWAESLAKKENLLFEIIGASKLGRALIFIGNQNVSPEGVLVILSRQHPPEVTGYKAMQYFLDELFTHPLSKDFLSKYRVLIYPMVNPDGVDLGHWRHGAGGVDLNRDWAYYQQPEVAQITQDIYKKAGKTPVILGIDFHSTYRDVFYTNDTLSHFQFVKEAWLENMESEIQDYEVNEKPSSITRPVSKSWFFAAFGAEGVTYEVGDNTPDELIELKGRSSARGILQALTK